MNDANDELVRNPTQQEELGKITASMNGESRSESYTWSIIPLCY